MFTLLKFVLRASEIGLSIGSLSMSQPWFQTLPLLGENTLLVTVPLLLEIVILVTPMLSLSLSCTICCCHMLRLLNYTESTIR